MRSEHSTGAATEPTLLAVLAAAACQQDGGDLAGSPGLRFDEVMRDYSALPQPLHFTARNGSKLPYRYYPAAGDRSDVAAALILIHGSGHHSRYLMPLAEALAAAGAAHVYTPDLRGHGICPERRGDIDYVDQLEDDLADLSRVVAAAHPQSPVVIGGHSSGGGLALRFAGGRYSDAAAGYLLLAPFLHHTTPTARNDGGGWANPRVPQIIALSIGDRMGLTWLQDTVVIQFNMPSAYRDGSETLAYSYRLNTGFAPRDYRTDLAAIDVPLLVLAGADDEAFVASEYPGTIRQSAKHAEVALLPGVSHIGVAVGPETQKRVTEWLDRLPR